MAKVAVASSDGTLINEHFGSAEEFLVYEVSEDGSYRLIERRPRQRGGEGGADHGAAVQAAELLGDVEAVLTAQIGRNAENILQGRGVKAYAITGTIDKALSAYGRKSRLIRNLSIGASGCGPAGGGCSGCGAKAGGGCCGR
jgi:nitrogen fixation protein NifB